jgi:hypothetical protein
MESVMALQVLTMEELKHLSFEEVIRQVLAEQKTLTVRISDDQEVTIQLKPALKPMLVLDGYLPEGWKDAIYG